MTRRRTRLLIGLVVAVALAWGATLDLTAAKAAAKATAKAATTAVAKAAAPAATKAATAAPQGKSKTQPAASNACTVNGKTYKNCPPALLKQAKREAARQNAAPQKKGVAVQFAGVSLATASKSPLAPVAALGAGATIAAFSAQPDYFAVGNYANSPLPVITAGVVSGGMRKFVNTLPGLCGITTPDPLLNQCIPLATADALTFPGSDFYRIGLKEYSKQMHTDLPATPLRGYYDMIADPTGASQQYLGPLILATRNRPTRVLFTNQIATDLAVPVDTTYMGAGMVNGTVNGVLTSQASSKKRATLHLHGGNTPWISDGTTHQWITPAGGDGQPAAAGFAKGFSAMNVPDMTSVNPTPSFIDGMQTFYWTNQQSGRLMFYHDHAYGITRLNVYAGEAAGYLLVDPAQESALATATAPGTIVTDPATGAVVSADLTHMFPLVIQDKTFVPDPLTQLAAQDPTWDVAAGGGLGSLWFPHVYMPNQNPADITGANGFGRWDYGPWFFPPQNASTFVPAGQPYQCTSAAYPGGANLAFPPLICPGTPLPSGTPESFMDTPLVNGTAYPTLTVAPAAYRFQVLNAANDRGLNLGLYVAEPVTLSPIITSPGAGYTNPTVTIGGCTGGTAFAQVGDGIDPGTGLPFTAGIVGITIGTQPSACTAPTLTIADTAPGIGAGAAASVVMSTNTDVHMVPAIPQTAGRLTPNCSLKAPMAGGGQVTALFDATGNPLNGTGLQAGCWPLYANAQGFTAGPFGENGGQLSWGNSDARTGGIPDPLTAGPPIIQIGAEGGVLPKLTVIPSTPVSFDYNKRSITVLNVLNHGLWLGPAERADIIVDFSNPAFAGKTLILYNDAPAPIPAGDPRIDYYTNNPDQSSSGGAPSTIAGYGPNTRTIMQIIVGPGSGNAVPLSVPTLAAALPNIFAATQDKVILAEPDYPVANGNGPATYIPIQATSINAWVGGGIGALTLTNGGAGYTSPVTVAINGGGGTGATATATLGPAPVASLALTNGGSNYSSAPAVSISGGGGTGATATAVLAGRSVASIAITNGGSGYLAAPTVTIAAPAGCTAGCITATATATVGTTGQRRVIAITITNPGAGYITVPAITFTPVNGGTGAAATATLNRVPVAAVNLTNGGSGYLSVPTVAFSGGNGTGAAATATLAGAVITGLTVTNVGTGYTSTPTVAISGGAGTGATATVAAPSVPLLPKTIQELFTLDYGRMNATLGVELPFTNFLTQTTIPYGYADPPTEIFKDGETQLWKITHNGVDTHFIHFHLFTVQVINRVGWDGAIKPPDPYELGLKDTVRMNPLEDIIVALRPFKQTLPFAVPNSNRPMDVVQPVGFTSTLEFTNVDPENNPATVVNDFVNFGWEYVWHCHILGHEENDMMRAMILAVAPTVPTVTGATGLTRGTTTLSISASATNSTAVPSGFTILRSTSASGPFAVVGSVPATLDATRTIATATFGDSGLARGATYWYQVVSNNVVGYTQTYAAPAVGYPHPSADSAPSPAVSAVAAR